MNFPSLVIHLRNVLLATLISTLGGMLISVPVNVAADPGAAKFAWFGGSISPAERIDAHNIRTHLFTALGAFLGLFVALRSLAPDSLDHRTPPRTPEPLGQERQNGVVAGKGASDDEKSSLEAETKVPEDEPVACVSCGSVIPPGSTVCSECGWTYELGTE